MVAVTCRHGEVHVLWAGLPKGRDLSLEGMVPFRQGEVAPAPGILVREPGVVRPVVWVWGVASSSRAIFSFVLLVALYAYVLVCWKSHVAE